MRAPRTVLAATIAALLVTGVSACGASQADEFAEQLRKAGYTEVAAEADYDETYNRRKKKNEKKLDDYEATAKAGSCAVEIEQDPDSTDYVIETAAGKDVSFSNLTAAALIAELDKQGVKC